jgi:predicted nucleotidyltransferase component of viral defense system
MIPRSEIFAVARTSGIRAENIERDYILGWLLKSSVETRGFTGRYAFKGGAALRKLYFPDYRYSQDLDFTILSAMSERDLRQVLEEAVQSGRQNSGIIFRVADLFTAREVPGEEAYRVRIEYEGPLGRLGGTQPRITIDATLYEKVVLPLAQRQLHHPYSDQDVCQAVIAVYPLEEMLAEKMRALLRRRYARDVYDLWYLFKHHAQEMDLGAARRALDEKCRHKGFTFSKVDDFLSTAHRGDLERTWTASLEYQIQDLPKYRTVEVELRKWLGDFLSM